MATGRVKSLQCKSNALDDVYHPKDSLLKKTLLPFSSYGSSSQALRDVLLFPHHPSLPKNPSSHRRPNLSPPPKLQDMPKRKPKPKPTSPLPPSLAHGLPTLVELPEGHSSRRVVEIFSISSWARHEAPSSSQIEMLFRVHNPPRTATRFVEYRVAICARSSGDARCAADGNEMMQIHCCHSLPSLSLSAPNPFLSMTPHTPLHHLLLYLPSLDLTDLCRDAAAALLAMAIPSPHRQILIAHNDVVDLNGSSCSWVYEARYPFVCVRVYWIYYWKGSDHWCCL